MIPTCLLLTLVATRTQDVLPLDGTWSITAGDPGDRQAEWRPVTVPDAFESALGDDYDGVATYRHEFVAPTTLRGDRYFVEFDAVATSAHVFFNGNLVGEHLGGWTRFRCDVTKYLRKSHPNSLQVVVDEKVGHDTQGFLPIVQPHFGGIWQSVRLVAENSPHFDEERVLTFGDFASKRLIVEAPLLAGAGDSRIELELDLGDRKVVHTITAGRNEIAVDAVEPWQPFAPKLYPVRLRLLSDSGEELDSVTRTVGFRTLVADGRRIVFNGSPLAVRGILEWGYYPPLRAPNLGVEEFERQVREAQARGFNLIKFCLWMPPRRLLDVMDRLGMLAWIEYPTWHPSFAESTRGALLTEFDEFFHHDRSHPSVIVRSLTCETGPSAPLEVMRDLYDRAHAVIPNAFVEDDSSWIAWNRVHDFYDDHPYGNNSTWPATLARLELHIADRKPMPLLLGEAIAADTWLDRATVSSAPERFRPIGFDALSAWEGRFAGRYGARLVPYLTIDSLDHCLEQRKDQIEIFRLLQPNSGYVVSVARDFRLASMGLADAFDRWKWRSDQFAWHGDTMILLGATTPRAFAAGTPLALPVVVAHHGREPLPAGVLRWRLGEEDEGEIAHGEILPGTVAAIGTIESEVPDVFGVYRMPLDVTVGVGIHERTNSWRLFAVPDYANDAHDHDHGEQDHDSADSSHDDTGLIPVVRSLTLDVIAKITAGARVILETSDAPGSFVAENRWMLRGTLWMPDHPLIDSLGRDFFTRLCVKDLHPHGLVPIDELFDHADVIVGFVDSHDVAITTDYAMLFQARIGDGLLVVSSLPLEGSAAADYLRRAIIDHTMESELPTRALPPSLVAAMRDRLIAITQDLTPREWQFRIEPEGGEPGAWDTIRVGQSWEGQGYPTLDGHARYRLEFELTDEFVGKPLYLDVAGADDAYWVTFDGAERGAGGDVENRKTAFDTPASHLLAESATPGRHVLEIVVYDWYGAGGLHRPISLSTAPLAEDATFIRGR